LLFDFVVTEQVFTLETDSVDFIAKMKIKDSYENDVFFAYSKYTQKIGLEAEQSRLKLLEAKEKKDTASENRYRMEMKKAEEKVTEYRKQVMKEQPNSLMGKVFKMMMEITIPDAPKLPNGTIDSNFQYQYYLQHYFDNIDLTDDRIVRTPIFHNKMESYMTKIVIQIPDTIIKYADMLVQKSLKSKENSKYIIYWITNHYESSQYMGMDAVFTFMALKYYTDKNITYWLDDALRFKITDRAQLLNYNLLGKKGQNLTMPDSAGNYHSLYNIRAKYTVLIFWNATCGKCKEELPKLKTLYEEQNATINIKALKKVDVYAVSLTEDPLEWKKYLIENKFPWVNVYDPNHENNYRRYYDIYSTPVIYLLGEDKKIIAKRLNIDQVKEFIEKGIE
jgi:thiol-disulfide isomerase/thioredoxin